jgi:hypothetical protein
VKAQRILRLALDDTDMNVASQAADTLAYQALEYPEEVQLDKRIIAWFRQLVAQSPRAASDDVRAVLERFDHKQ